MGRPAHKQALRTASGHKSRSKEALSMEERLNLDAATWKRRQLNPVLTITEARNPEWGSVVERWHQDWKAMSKRCPDKAHVNMFSQLHKDAAERYHALYLRWLSVISARSPRSASDFSGVGSYDGSDPFEQDRADRDRKTEADFKAARHAVLQSGPLGMMAMESIVIENQPVESLRGDLRLALNRLAVLWRMMEE